MSPKRAHVLSRSLRYLAETIKSLFSTSGKRRLAFYVAVIAVIGAANSGIVGAVLRFLQFNPDTVARWEEALRSETLSLIALFVVGLYLDFVIRSAEREQTRETLKQLEQERLSQIGAVLANELKLLHDSISDNQSNLAKNSEARLTEATTKAVLSEIAPVIRAAIADPLSLASPEERIRTALANVLVNHSQSFPNVMRSILGVNPSTIIDDASITFTLRSLPGDEYIELTYNFRGTMRRNTYSIMLAQGLFQAENRILATGDITDAWVLLDEKSFDGSMALSSRNTAEIRYRDKSGNWINEVRPFVTSEARLSLGVSRCQVQTVDLTPPPDSQGPCESVIVTRVVLPARPPGLRWFFDNPIYIEEIVFDVAGLWPDWEIDFTLYPFLLGTEDYTQRSDTRQPKYRIGIRNWLSRGHGVILIWDRIGRKSVED